MEVRAKYAGYIERQQDEIDRQRRNEETSLPLDLDYATIAGLSTEVRQKLVEAQPTHSGSGFACSGRHAGSSVDPARASQEAQPRWPEPRGMSAFTQRLASVWDRNNSLVCVGLDPEIERLPPSIAGEASPIFQFNKAIIDATADLVCSYKPQFAHYAAYEAEDQLERTIDYIQPAIIRTCR